MAGVNTIDKFGRKRNATIGVIRGPPGIGFKLTPVGDYDIQGKCLNNVAAPKKKTDGVNQEYVDKKVFTITQTIADILNKDIMPLIRDNADKIAKIKGQNVNIITKVVDTDLQGELEVRNNNKGQNVNIITKVLDTDLKRELEVRKNNFRIE